MDSLPETRVVMISGEYAEETACYWHREGTNDYKNEGFEIEVLIDRDGSEHQPRWGDDPIQLIPGVTAWKDQQGRHLRIERSACPVRVKMCEWYEYVSYDSADHNSSWRRPYWVRYEAAEREPPSEDGS